MQAVDPSLVALAATSLAALVIVGFVFWSHRKKAGARETPLEEIEIPTKWTKVGEIGEIVLYPMKGAKRMHLDKAECTRQCIREVATADKLALIDRLFVAYNEKNEFLSIKKNTKVLFVEVRAVDERRVRFTYLDTPDLTVQIPDTNNNLSHIDIYHGEKVQTVDCGDEAAQWISQRMLSKDSGLRLGCFVQNLVTPRTVQGTYDKRHTEVYPNFRSDYMGTNHNLASYMLLSEASIDDLNLRITRSPVHPHYFRPNIVVKGTPAYSEDGWDWIRLGEHVVLRGFKTCTRCTITTVDPETGARDPKIEPLKTLRSFRQLKEPAQRAIDGTDPVMGLYAGCHRTGIIHVGDPVYINSV